MTGSNGNRAAALRIGDEGVGPSRHAPSRPERPRGGGRMTRTNESRAALLAVGGGVHGRAAADPGARGGDG
jgi:hypothetical protein